MPISNLQDGILAELIKVSGIKSRTLPVAPTSDPTARVIDSTGDGAGDATRDAVRLALLPETVPVLPEAFSARSNDQALVLDVLLDRTDEVGGRSKVSAHGMGGLGKTTLAASVVRSAEVRAAFAKIGFVSAGQSPATLDVQRTLYAQLVGSNMEVNSSATPASTTSIRIGAAAACFAPTCRTKANLKDEPISLGHAADATANGVRWL